MVNYDAPLYQHPAEKWDAARCRKEANHTATDGMGTKFPFKGYLSPRYGVTRYNGGCIREDEWWQGENVPFPSIPESYAIVRVPAWGYRIVERTSECGRPGITG